MKGENEFDMGVFGEEEDITLNLEEDNPFLEKDDIKGDDEESQEQTDENNSNTEDDKEGSENVGSEDKDDEEGEGNSDTDDSSPEIFTSFASLLSEKGLLPSFDSENHKISSEDDLADLVRSEIETQSQSYLKGKLGEDGYEALEKGVSLSEYQQYQEGLNALDSVDEDTLRDNPELSKKIILEDYKAQGLSEERAARLLSRSIDAGEDSILEDARESLSSLKEVQKLEFQRQQEQVAEQRRIQAEQQEKMDNDLKNSIYSTEEIIDGVKLSKEIKDRMYDTMTKVVTKNENGVLENQLMKDRRENPIEFDTKLYYMYELTKGFKDFSKITNTTRSAVVSDFEKTLRSNKRFEDSGSPDFLKDSDSYAGMGDELKL